MKTEPRWEKPEDGSKWNPGDRVRVSYAGQFKLFEGAMPRWLVIHCGYNNLEIQVVKHESGSVVVKPMDPEESDGESGDFAIMDSEGCFHNPTNASTFAIPEGYIIGAMDFDETAPEEEEASQAMKPAEFQNLVKRAAKDALSLGYEPPRDRGRVRAYRGRIRSAPRFLTTDCQPARVYS